MLNEYLNNHSLNLDYIKRDFCVEADENSLRIPVYDGDENLLYYKVRHFDYERRKDEGAVKFTYSPTGGHATLFAAHKIKDKDIVILSEGEIDCMKLWQEGFPAATSTSGVRTFNTEIAAPLKGKFVYICLDTDKAGIDGVEKCCQVLTEIGIVFKIINLPKESKDVCEYFTAGYKAENFKELMANALTFDDWQIKHDPEEFSFETGEEILNQEFPPEEWYIDRILPTEGFVFIVGAEATGKSFYTLTLAESLTTGKPWLGKFEVKKKTNVLFIDKENTNRRIHTRMKNLKISGEGMFWLKYPQYFELNDPDQEDGFSSFVKSAARKITKEGIGVIFIDSFTDVMVDNENVASDVQRFFDSFRQLFPGRTIAVLHHESKPSQGVYRTSSQKVRGSSNITAQMVVGFRSSPIPKVNNEFSFEQIKAGDSEKLNKFKVILVKEPDPTDVEKTIITRLEYGGEIFDELEKLESAVEAIGDLFDEENSIPRKMIVEKLGSFGISPGTTARAMKNMVDAGTLEIVKNGRESNYVWIKP